MTRTLASLSPGGSDAIVRREFDLVTKRFVNDKAFRLDDPARARGLIDTIFSARTWAKTAT